MTAQRILSLFAVLLLIGVLIVAGSHSQKPAPSAQRNPVVINNTKSLAVISAVRNGEELYIAFRNDNTRNITAYAISVGEHRFTQDFAYSELVDAGIPPNNTYERRTPFPELTTKPTIIEAVFFEGGAAEGTAAVVQEITDDRLVGRIQIERTLKALSHHLDSQRPMSNAEFTALKAEIVSQLDSSESVNLTALNKLKPAEQSNKLSELIQSGFGDGRQRILRKLQDVSSAPNPDEELVKMKEQYERILRRF
jgi:hypothetical protein